jgi:hypothetical protein
MAALEVIALDTATPQLRAPGASDTYTHPRQSLFLAGTAAAPGIAGNSDDNTGMLWPAADTVAWATGGTERARITSGGDLLVNTTSTSSLVASGRGLIEVNGNDSAFALKANNTLSGYLYNSTSEFRVANATANPVTFFTNNTERMRLDSSGNLGLGVTPSAWYTASGDVRGFDVSTKGAFWSGSGVDAGVLGNAYFSTGFDFKYKTTAAATRYDQLSGAHAWYTAPSGTAGNAISFTQALTLTAAPNLKLGGTADRATTAGTNHLDIFNGTAPVGTLANGISLYSDAGEAYVMDAAGNATLFSPHDAETNEWIFRSKHTPTGKVLKIDVERLLRFVNDHFGLDAVEEFIES